MSRSKNKPKANQKTVIEIWGYGVDVEFALIPEERGRELESYEEDEEQESEDDYKSFSEQLWEILDSQMNGFGGATEVSLFVNDKEIESFTVDEEQAKKHGRKNTMLWAMGCNGLSVRSLGQKDAGER